MASLPRMIPVRRHYVIDTGYLDDLYSVDGYSHADATQRVKGKFLACIEQNDILYVPFPVLFEVGRHIVEVKSAPRRRDLAVRLRDDVLSSCVERQPWVIPGTDGEAAATGLAATLLECCDRFANIFATQGETLADVAVIREAEKLKGRYLKARDRRHQVHIWTRDHAVKAYEPHTEEDAFV